MLRTVLAILAVAGCASATFAQNSLDIKTINPESFRAIADFTYHTDFAQVEADQAVVNLTRFSLVFSEKRQSPMGRHPTTDLQRQP